MGEHVPVQSATCDRAVVHNDTTVGRSGPTSRPSLPDNTLIDYITGETIAEAIAEQVGFDRRGNPVYHRSPDGEIVLTEQVERERIRINGRSVDRVLHRRRPELDNDLPLIAKRYRELRQRYQVPGRSGRGRE